MHMFVGDWMARGAAYWPQTVAVVDGPRQVGGRAVRYTYAAMNARADRLAGWLRDVAGVARGERVGVLSLNGVEVLDALFACGKLGAVLVPYNWRLHAGELAEQVRLTSPRVLLFGGDFREAAAEVRERTGGPAVLVHLDGWGLPGSHPYADVVEGVDAGTPAAPVANPAVREEDVLCLLFTGGTTGRAKAAQVSYRQVAWNTLSTLVHEVRPGDVTLTHTPLFHTGALFVYTLPLLTAGGRVVLMRRWDAQGALALLAEEKVTLFFAVPTQYQQLLEAPGFARADLSSLRFLTSGGAPMPVPLLRAWQEAHGGVPFKQGFGMTEFGPGVFSMDAASAAAKQGTVGRPNHFVAARLVDEEGRDVPRGEVGELLLKGPAMCSGYFEDPAATAEAIDAEGWLHTGDLARADADGFYSIVGRRKDMFISGGENVYPVEVEDALHAHPAVAQAAVVGVPDPKWGEVGRAFVVLQAGADATEAALLEHLRTRLARFKVPKAVTLLSAMPVSAAGKILKRALRELPPTP
jgi:fatty-acyl-CoA synthase